MSDLKITWKLSAFAAMGEKVAVAVTAAKQVKAISEAEVNDTRTAYLAANERQMEVAGKFLETGKQRDNAIKASDTPKLRELEIQLRVEKALVDKLDAQQKALHDKQKQAEDRPGKLTSDLAELKKTQAMLTDRKNILEQRRQAENDSRAAGKEYFEQRVKDGEKEVAALEATEQELWGSVQSCILSTQRKEDLKADQKADDAARKNWKGDKRDAYLKLAADVGKKEGQANELAVKSQVLAQDLKLYQNVDALKEEVTKSERDVKRMTAAKEAAEKEKTRIDKQYFPDAKEKEEAAKSLGAVDKQLKEAEERLAKAKMDQHFAERKIGSDKPVLPREELRDRKEKADVAKAQLDMDIAKVSIQKAGIAVEESGRQRKEAQDKFDAKLGPELVGKVALAAKKRDEEFAKVRQAQDVIDLVKTAALSPADPVAALAAAEKNRDAAQKALDKTDKELKAAEAQLATAAEKNKPSLQLYIDAMKEDKAARAAELDIATTAAEQRKTANAKLEASGALAVKTKQLKSEADLTKASDELTKLRAETALLDPTKDASKIEANKLLLTAKEKEIQAKRAEIKKQQTELDKLTAAAVKTEKGALDGALEAAKKADGDFAKTDEEKQAKIKGDEELTKMQTALADVNATEQRAMAEKIMAETSVDAAAKNLAIADFQQKISQGKDKNQAAFAKFAKLTDQSFEDMFKEQDGDFESDIHKLALITDPKDPNKKVPNPDYEQDYNTAKEAFVQLIEQDQILEDMGASFEDRLRAFEGVPKPLWPPKFRAEVKAYRDVSLLITEEKVKQKEKEAAKKEVKDELFKTLGEAYKKVAPVVDLLFDAWDSYSSISGLGAEPESPDFSKAKDQLLLMKSIGAAMASYVKSGYDAAEELSGEEGEDGEEGDVGEKVSHDEALKILEFTKAMLVAQTTAVGSVLTAVGKEIPGIDVALGAIETAEAMYAAGKAIKLAYDESEIKAEVEADNDEIMKKAMANQGGRSKEIAVKRSVHATAKGTQLAGAAVTASGVAAPVGVGLKVGGKGLEHGNKFAFQCVDWKAAARSKATLEKAIAGSYDAMQQVFADHQMYATSYIVLKARDGDGAALKMCVGRGIDQGKLLDEGTSVKMIRQMMLKTVDQEDEMETVGETAANTWDKLCKAGKVIKAVFVDEAPKEEPKPPPQQAATGPIEAIPGQPKVKEYLQRAEDVSSRFAAEPTGYTFDDCAFRGLMVDNTVPNIRQLLEAKKPEEIQVQAGVPAAELKTQADTIHRLLFALPKKPLSQAARPAKKQFSTAEEMLRRTR